MKLAILSSQNLKLKHNLKIVNNCWTNLLPPQSSATFSVVTSTCKPLSGREIQCSGCVKHRFLCENKRLLSALLPWGYIAQDMMNRLIDFLAGSSFGRRLLHVEFWKHVSTCIPIYKTLVRSNVFSSTMFRPSKTIASRESSFGHLEDLSNRSFQEGRNREFNTSRATAVLLCGAWGGTSSVTSNDK